MKGDFARMSFDPALHYSQVFQQQGRVLLEADWNEQGRIQLHLLRAFVRDLVGPCWAPGGGFALTTSSTDPNGNQKALPLTDWQLAPGHCYVDGVLCVNESPCSLAQQPQAPTPDYGVGDGKSGFENPPASFALWLDVWERHLCALEAPGIADLALDGIDTASRAQVVWQVRLLDQAHAQQRLDDVTAALNARTGSPGADAAAIRQQLAEVAKLRGSLGGAACAPVRQVLGARDAYALPRLAAALGPVAADDDPCVIAADARYRGCENQLYRVEIHQDGLAGTAAAAGTASFKWSRENGSVVFPVGDSVPGAAAADGSAQLVVTLAALGRDARLGLAQNDWVELVDDDYTLGQRAYPLLQVLAIDAASCTVTLAVPKGIAPWSLSNDPHKHPLLRRWDQGAGANAQGVLPVVEGTAITLEDGIQVTFAPGGLYATGDYWLIPARVAGNGQLDWPADASGAAAALPPRGRHHYAALGVNGANGYQECCCRFGTLCDLLQANANRPAAAASPAAVPPAATATAATAASRAAATKPAASKAKGKAAATRKKSP